MSRIDPLQPWSGRLGLAAFAVALSLATLPAAAQTVLLEFGDTARYLANTADPGLGTGWVDPAFDDSGWASGQYGIGNESGTGAAALLRTDVGGGVFSVYTRIRFTIVDPAAVTNMYLGVDYDDGYVAWVNGQEVSRSGSMPSGVAPAWNESPSLHESSNGATPNYEPLDSISTLALPVLVAGQNVLAIGVWNVDDASSDLVLVPRLSIDEPARIPRGPYLQKATPSSIIIRWRTDAAEESVVAYGPSPTSLGLTVSDPAVTADHELELTGLSPDTLYYYSVGTSSVVRVGADSGHYFRTPPVVGTAKPFRVWAIGDAGTGTSEQMAVRDAYLGFSPGVETDLWLMLGDNAYDDGTDADYGQKVFSMYKSTLRTAAVWPTLGNHDARSAASGTESGVYYDVFSLPRLGEAGGLPSTTEAYYSFDFANVHFQCLDSEDSDTTKTGAMMTWSRADLDDTLQDWAIAFWHHPPYSKGSHDSDTSSQLIDMRERAVDELELRGIDLVFSGHSHSYERSWLIDGHYGDSNSFDPALHAIDYGNGRPGSDGAYLKPLGLTPHNGAVYTVAGSSGKTSPEGSLAHEAMYRSRRVLGSVILDFNRNRLDVTFLEDDGSREDYYTLIKGGSAPPARPQNLVAAVAAGCALELQWTDSGSDEDGYEVERSLDGLAWAPLTTVGVNVTSHVDTTAVAGATYHYRVRGYNPAGPAAWSNVAIATLPSSLPVGPVGNTLLLVRAGGGAVIHSTWLDVAPATGYDLHRDSVKSGTFPTIAGSAASGIPPLSLPTPPEPRVFYRVGGVNGCSIGPL